MNQKNTENKSDNLLQKAEKLLIHKVKKSELHLTDSYNLRLIHQLEVHQLNLKCKMRS